MATATNRAVRRPPTAELATTSGTWRLVVGFHWCEDRFEHRIVVIPNRADQAFSIAHPGGEAGAEPWPITEIVAHDTTSNWPLNPPLQQLDECLLAGPRRGVVGLGMAGTSHWSLAVEARDRELWFDLACRIQERPVLLQSCYHLADRLIWSGSASPESGQTVLRATADGRLVPLARLAADETTTEMSLSDDRRVVRLVPREIDERLPATVRWRYGWIAPA